MSIYPILMSRCYFWHNRYYIPLGLHETLLRHLQRQACEALVLASCGRASFYWSFGRQRNPYHDSSRTPAKLAELVSTTLQCVSSKMRLV